MLRRGVLVTMKLPCSSCGAPIMPTTAARTGGLCMPCFQHPGDLDGKGARQKLLEQTPTPELLKQLDAAVRTDLTAAAVDAVERLGSERIYGFVLLHYIFQSVRVSVFTEAKLEQSACGRPVSELDRWSPPDVSHYFYREDLFHRSNEIFGPLESGAQTDNEVARIFIRAMRHVRQNVIADPDVVLSVMDYSEGPGVTFYAYAELFNDPEALARLRAELYPGAHWDYLDLERSRVPKV